MLGLHKIQAKGPLQIFPLIIREFKQINYLLFTLKSSENLRFSDDFRGIEVN